MNPQPSSIHRPMPNCAAAAHKHCISSGLQPQSLQSQSLQSQPLLLNSPSLYSRLVNGCVRSLPILAVAWLLTSVTGCISVPISVSNPVPGLTTVAVSPFFNLSAEPSVDGRRFSQAYFAELQKMPGFQVVPLGVVEQAINENRLDMNSPTDAVRLCEILGADAVVVGGVTDYSPYYPPQLGLHVQWYSPLRWQLAGNLGAGDCPPGVCPPAGMTTGEYPASIESGAGIQRTAAEPVGLMIRGQSAEIEDSVGTGSAGAGQLLAQLGGGFALPVPVISSISQQRVQPPPGPSLWPSRDRGQNAVSGFGAGKSTGSTPGTAAGTDSMTADPAVGIGSSGSGTVAGELGSAMSGPPVPGQNGMVADGDSPSIAAAAPTVPAAAMLPLMSYTRFFDGADPALVWQLRRYYAWRGDFRSGGWESYLYRSDDFLRFTAHVMIVEMLSLHGGRVKSETIFQPWKLR